METASGAPGGPGNSLAAATHLAKRAIRSTLDAEAMASGGAACSRRYMVPVRKSGRAALVALYGAHIGARNLAVVRNLARC